MAIIVQNGSCNVLTSPAKTRVERGRSARSADHVVDQLDCCRERILGQRKI
jgi:hypothetical protein